MYKHLLVPIDGSPLASVIVEQAVAFAKAGQAKLTFLHVRADMSVSGDGALLHAISEAGFSEASAGNGRAIVAKAEVQARAGGVAYDSLVLTSDRPHEAILEAARSISCDAVFMASHGRRGLKGVLLGSVTRGVLEQAYLPVVIAAIESNLIAKSEEQKVVAILREEHRSLAAVVYALLSLLDDPADATDKALLSAMLFYIEQFPERLHHPKEDAFLFRKLRERTTECDALLAGLERQHSTGAARFIAMRNALDAGDLDKLTEQARSYAQLQWNHMATEEQLLLPAAARHLSAADWKEIFAAIADDGDPRFGADESFDALASRLLELASPSGMDARIQRDRTKTGRG